MEKKDHAMRSTLPISPSGRPLLLVSLWVLMLATPASADFRLLNGWGEVRAEAGDASHSQSHTGPAGTLSVTAQAEKDLASWTVVATLNWGADAGPLSGWRIRAGLAPEWDAPVGAHQLAQVQGSWTIEIGDTQEAFYASNPLYPFGMPTLSIYDLTAGALAYTVDDDSGGYLEGILQPGHLYRLDLSGQATLDGAGLEFGLSSLPVAVPAPGAALLGLIGVAGVAAFRRKPPVAG